MRRHIWTIFWKEFRDIFRDKRTTFGVIISPLLLTPVLLAFIGSFISGQAKQAQAETLTVGIIGADASPAILETLKGVPNLNLRLETTTRETAEARIRDRSLRAVAELPPDAQQRLTAGQTVPVKILMDVGNDKSRLAGERLKAGFNAAGSVALTRRLEALNLPPEFATPFKLTEEPIKTGGSAGTLVIASLLPYMLALACFSSGIYAANDLVAGEKERGSLETLLASPASRRDIVLGKFLAVMSVCLAGSLLSIAGLMIPFFSGLEVYAWLVRGGLQLNPMGIGVTLLMQIPLAVLFAGLLIAISTFSRNQKEAQSYLGPLLIAIIVPAMMSMFLGAEVSRTMALVPVLNASLIIKQALLNSYDTAFILIALAASALYAAISVLFCTRLFQKESVLIKS